MRERLKNKWPFYDESKINHKYLRIWISITDNDLMIGRQKSQGCPFWEKPNFNSWWILACLKVIELIQHTLENKIRNLLWHKLWWWIKGHSISTQFFFWSVVTSVASITVEINKILYYCESMIIWEKSIFIIDQNTHRGFFSCNSKRRLFHFVS